MAATARGGLSRSQETRLTKSETLDTEPGNLNFNQTPQVTLLLVPVLQPLYCRMQHFSRFIAGAYSLLDKTAETTSHSHAQVSNSWLCWWDISSTEWIPSKSVSLHQEAFHVSQAALRLLILPFIFWKTTALQAVSCRKGQTSPLMYFIVITQT